MSDLPVRLLTVFQVAERLTVCVRQVRTYIADGRLKVKRLGRLVRVEETELARFIKSLPG